MLLMGSFYIFFMTYVLNRLLFQWNSPNSQYGRLNTYNKYCVYIIANIGMLNKIVYFRHRDICTAQHFGCGWTIVITRPFPYFRKITIFFVLSKEIAEGSRISFFKEIAEGSRMANDIITGKLRLGEQTVRESIARGGPICFF